MLLAKRLAFVSLCLATAWLGSNLASADPDPLFNYECRTWQCQGTHNGCVLETTPGHFINGCYQETLQWCRVMSATGVCPGTHMMSGMPCNVQWPDCLLD
jgi:hypothetical protein